MRSLSNTAFVALLESGAAKWPPFQLGGFVYAQLANPDVSNVGYEIVRTEVPV